MIKGMMDMMKQASSLQENMARIKQEVEALEVSARTGGDMVTVTLNGAGHMTGLQIDPSLMKPEEHGIVEDLVRTAHANAKLKLEQAMQEKLSSITGGLPLPPGFKL